MVHVHSKSNDDESGKQWVWASSADSTFSVYEDEGEDLGRGTKIVLSLKEDCLEFLEEERLKGLIKRYSEFINFPIYLYTTKVRPRAGVGVRARVRARVRVRVRPLLCLRPLRPPRPLTTLPRPASSPPPIPPPPPIPFPSQDGRGRRSP